MTAESVVPQIIQGGMGVAVSNWRLAATVSRLGQLGVVSGTALEQVLARRLQDGDPGGHMRRALDRFPIPSMAERAWSAYYVAGGKSALASYKTVPMHERYNSRELQELCILANFAEVTLAREGHANDVGINYLEKIQVPHLPSMYGAMLAGVGYILMGAGIPNRVPGALDRLARHEDAAYPLHVTGAVAGDDTTLTFSPREFLPGELPPLRRPLFLAIVASDVLALTLARKSNGRVDGFVVEGPAAGGHNAPPRGKLQLNRRGEPVYGERDEVDLKRLRDIGLPFWLAGGYGSADGLRAALEHGAAGIQVGTAFAFCEESGIRDDYRREILARVSDRSIQVFTDPRASPAGFPFKVVRLRGTLADDRLFLMRPRICDLGYLREPYRMPDGAVGFRCPAEPTSVYVGKGGDFEDTIGRKCVCNALMANVGLGQVRAGRHVEQGLVTAGDDLAMGIQQFLEDGRGTYSAADVIARILGGPSSDRGAASSAGPTDS
ncbi:MAG: nitronate monooxygenase [Acidobacteriota bacterium]